MAEKSEDEGTTGHLYIDTHTWDSGTRKRHVLYRLVYMTAFLLLGSLLPLLYFRTQLQFDESLFLVLGDQLQNGAVLYADVADHKPPALPWIAGLLTGSVAEPHTAARILTYIVNALAALAVGVLGHHLRTARTGVIASFLYLVTVYLPHFEGYHFNTEPFANLFLILGVLALVQGRSRYDVIGGSAIAVAGLFNQSAWLIGVPVLVYLFLRWRTRDDWNRTDLVVSVAGIGLGVTVPVVAAGTVLYLNGALVDAILYTVYYPITGYSRHINLLSQIVGLLTYLPVWLLVAAELGLLGAALRGRREVDAERLFVVSWLVVLCYPGFTGFGGKDRVLFAFPPAVLLAGMMLSRVHGAVFPLSESSGISAYWSSLTPAQSRSVEEMLVIVFIGVVVLAAGLNAVQFSVQTQESLADQQATAAQIESQVDGPTYLLTYRNSVPYFSEQISPAQTFIGYPYSATISERIVDDLEKQQIEYVLVPNEWVREDGTIEQGGLWTQQRAQIFEYVNENYERHHTFDEYVAVRRK